MAKYKKYSLAPTQPLPEWFKEYLAELRKMPKPQKTKPSSDYLQRDYDAVQVGDSQFDWGSDHG